VVLSPESSTPFADPSHSNQQLVLALDSDHHEKIATIRALKQFIPCSNAASHSAPGLVQETPNTIRYDCGCTYILSDSPQLASFFELVDMYQLNTGNIVLLYDTSHTFSESTLAPTLSAPENLDPVEPDSRLRVGIIEAYRYGGCIVKWWDDSRSVVHPSALNNIEQDDRENSFDVEEDISLPVMITPSSIPVEPTAGEIASLPEPCPQDEPCLVLSPPPSSILGLEQFLARPQAPPPPCFEIIHGSPPSSHTFIASPATAMKPNRLKKEYQILQQLTHDMGILVRGYTQRTDLFTIFLQRSPLPPYYGGLFQFDLYLPANYPAEPPKMKFVSKFGGTHKLHPNLYLDGHICLSLLGTWNSKQSTEQWTVDSNLYQVLVSLSGLILGCPIPSSPKPVMTSNVGPNRAAWTAFSSTKVPSWVPSAPFSISILSNPINLPLHLSPINSIFKQFKSTT
jgi:ubiquitin-protein ligase